jgi:hypothetical protein
MQAVRQQGRCEKTGLPYDRGNIHKIYLIPDEESYYFFSSTANRNSFPCLPTDLAGYSLELSSDSTFY